MAVILSWFDRFTLFKFVRVFTAFSYFFVLPSLSFSTLPRFTIVWHLPFNGPCLIPVLLLMPFSHVVADTWCISSVLLCCWGSTEAGCCDTVMEWCVVEILKLLAKLCPSGTLKDEGSIGCVLKNFGDVLGDFVAGETAPFNCPFFFWITDEALMTIFRLGDGDFWCCSSLIKPFSDDAIVGSCCLNCRL